MAGVQKDGTSRGPIVSSTPFAYVQHLVTVPVIVDGETEARFVLDTGIGLTLVSARLAEALRVTSDGSSYTGRRMSGQAVTLPLAALGTLSFGSVTQEQHAVGILDRGFPDELADIGGFLSLGFFAETPFTVDYARRLVVVESAASLEARIAAGAAVDLKVRRDGPAVDVFLPFTVPGRGSIEVEVDMGSSSLILDEALAADVGVRLDHPDVQKVEGRDETGGAYTRYFTTLEGEVHPTGAPEIRQSRPDVMFQRIVHDGLVGDAFLRNFVVTYDVAGARMVFSQPRRTAEI